MKMIISGQFITIGQLLKKFGYVSTGGQVKHFLQSNIIKINGKIPQGRNSKVFVDSTLWINDELFKVINES